MEDLLRQLIKEMRGHVEVHSLFKGDYPLVLVTKDRMDFYKVNKEGDYDLVRQDTRPDWISTRVMAALPYEENAGQMTALVEACSLQTLEGRIGIQHEFVHCYQESLGLERLRQVLDICKEPDPLWELNFNFPYYDQEVGACLKQLADFRGTPCLSTKAFLNTLRDLRGCLRKLEFEYLVWQVWLEGFARFIENRLRLKHGLEEKYKTYDRMDRHVFYQVGDHYFRTLESMDLIKAFDHLYNLI